MSKELRETIESMRSEINYVLHSKKSNDVKKVYLENAVRYADRALGGRSLDVCPVCSGKNFIFDKIDLMGDGIEEHFGKIGVICPNCDVIIGYKE